ncbi:MAG TPA: RluA family pseudouridine synthase [Balneolaceae bacterium]|nr:RluA family pseudouridine synthase [Balneolaceae bacterium]|tara:strand:+ start:158893 stop:159819 length:927 start_codon:yes stop_codon:yes gene_type:complete
MTISKTGLFNSLPVAHRKVRITKPYPITYRFKAETEFVGKDILTLLKTKFPFNTEQVWKERIASGRILINDVVPDEHRMLKSGDQILHFNPHVVEPSVPDEVEILEITDDYAAVFKPAPLPMHPGGRYNRNTLVEMLKDDGFRDLLIVHRLDAVTSGLVLFARNKEFARKAMDCFAAGGVKKTYFAHVAGVPADLEVRISAPIRRKGGFVFESGEALSNAKDAVTHFEVVETRDNSSIIKCTPVTGRTHQIRLHLKHWGFPIIDDPIYGPNGDLSSKSPQKVGISLISSGLEIPDLGIKLSLVSSEEV